MTVSSSTIPVDRKLGTNARVTTILDFRPNC